MNTRWIPLVTKAVVALAAIAAVFLIARKTASTPSAKLLIESDGKGAVRIGVDGGERKPLQEILQTCWAQDAATTKSLVCSWGLEKGIIAAADLDSLKRFELVQASDFWGLNNALKVNHLSPNNVQFIQKLAQYFEAASTPEQRKLKLTWHRSEEIAGNVIVFPQGDTWFAQRLNQTCDVIVGEARVRLVVQKPARFPTPDRIQISEGTFVRLLNEADGRSILPTFRSRAWRRLTDRGTVEADVVC